MMKQGGMLLSGRAILGLCLVVIGLLTLGYGGVEFGFGLDGDQYLALYSQYA